MNQKQYRILVYGMIFLLAGCICMNIYLERIQMEKELQALVGSIYQTNPDAASLILQQAFSHPASPKNLKQGKEAAISLGYTEKAFQILRQDSTLIPERMIYLSLMFLLLIGLVILLKCRDQEEQQHKRILSARIHDACRSEWELIPDAKSDEWYPLECDIADILKQSRNLQQYLLKRETQLQHFIENIAHQIKTPLAGMILNIENLLEHMDSGANTETIQEHTDSGANTETIQEHMNFGTNTETTRDHMDSGTTAETTREKNIHLLSECIQLGEQIQNHIMRLLNLARMEAGKIHFRKDAVELMDLLDSLQKRYGTEHIVIQTQETEGLYITGDRDWLLEAMANMVENSFTHSNARKQVTINITALKDAVKINVTDHGKGMTPEELQCLFERYDTGNSSSSFSTGIGMNLARYVIQAHYSDIHVESTKGQGTKFEFRLPILHLKEKVITV